VMERWKCIHKEREKRREVLILKRPPAAYQPIAASLWAGPGEPDSALTIRLLKRKVFSLLYMRGLCLQVEAGSIKEEFEN